MDAGTDVENLVLGQEVSPVPLLHPLANRRGAGAGVGNLSVALIKICVLVMYGHFFQKDTKLKRILFRLIVSLFLSILFAKYQPKASLQKLIHCETDFSVNRTKWHQLA